MSDLDIPPHAGSARRTVAEITLIGVGTTVVAVSFIADPHAPGGDTVRSGTPENPTDTKKPLSQRLG